MQREEEIKRKQRQQHCLLLVFCEEKKVSGSTSGRLNFEMCFFGRKEKGRKRSDLRIVEDIGWMDKKYELRFERQLSKSHK